MQTSSLGAVLRAWRDRAKPSVLRRGRRAPGLRREELAASAGVSVDYVVRLEQGRAAHPSPQVVASLCRALQLTKAERTHLHQLAGIVEARATRVPSAVPDSLSRVMDRLVRTPAALFTATWTQVRCNREWEAVLGPQSLFVGRRRNLVWRLFTEPSTQLLRSPIEQADFAASMVSDLRGAAGRYPRDESLQSLIADLIEQSAVFARLWREARVEPHRSKTKTLLTTSGPLTLDCDVLATDGDLRLVVYTAEAGSPSARQLEALINSSRSR
ncbi:MAG: helix-turn-helix domain-containing protein [Archangium sp.]|nr:helix-turn-helix domain-containing protein [Archangium sp.]